MRSFFLWIALGFVAIVYGGHSDEETTSTDELSGMRMPSLPTSYTNQPESGTNMTVDGIVLPPELSQKYAYPPFSIVSSTMQRGGIIANEG